MSTHDFDIQDGRYTTSWAEERISVSLELPRSRGGETTAEVTVLDHSVEPARQLHAARMNISTTRSRTEVANYLAKRVPQAGHDWAGIIEVSCSEAIRAMREGEPAILLREAARPAGDDELLPPFLLARLPVILFGDGGSAKSYLALAMACALHGHGTPGLEPAEYRRVLYIDWEFTPEDHAARLDRLVPLPRAQQPGILYRRCTRPLVEEAESLARIIADEGVSYAILDSAGMACDGPPEGAEQALGYWGALRRLGVASLSLAHTNRSGDVKRPFGSTFWHNGARSTWHVKGEQVQPGLLRLALRHRKSNVGPLLSPVGFDVEFAAGRTYVRPGPPPGPERDEEER